MEQLIANITGQTRYETLNGRKYLVAPMSLISPGVLNGSKGPLYYPEEEVVKNADAWNHVPIVVYHPTLNGMAISARDPDVLNRQGIGFVFKAKADKKLVAEGWFDLEATERIDNRILESLEAGKQIELSTGLYTENEAASEGATFNGKAYDYVARNYKPDHLAILPDQVGACSVSDGCGVLVNSENCTCENKSNCKCKKTTFHVTNSDLSHSDLHEALNKELKAKYTQDEPSVWISEVFDSYLIYWQGDDLFKLPYSRSGVQVSLGSETPTKVVRETNFVTVSNRNKSMAKKELVDNLIANCNCWKEEDREVLNSMPEDKIKTLLDAANKTKDQEQVVNVATKALEEGFVTEDGTKFVFNKEQGKFAAVEKEPVTINKETQEPQTDEQWFASAPSGIKSAVQNAMRIEARERHNLVEKIVANGDGDDAKQLLRKRLANKPLEELEDYTLLLPKKEEPTANLASYFGATGGQPTTPQEIKEEPLPLPVINWSEKN